MPARMALYYYDTCPFCIRVLRAASKLGVDLELRDIFQDRKHYMDLTSARGRATVPVLRYTDADGEDVWMPESADIIRFLEAGGAA
ncbi:MAG: glutathione S-transferase N-terminal domain-containing protein [Myxococcales bacterium]|nr:glutathione S-transferase N-terminal domain-containing protein [Myxococcales bacterium]MCB9651696.1 glutathione S-transferase N-terminal domain-containing protein [Deltaproteobacteria bacterium]